jgi:hypothetical protein
MLPITKMIYNQSILTTTQYEDQSPGEKRHKIFVHPVFTCALKSLAPQGTPRKAPQDTTLK